MGIPEEAGKVAGDFFEAMKAQPLCLALAVVNLGLIALLWYAVAASGNIRQQEYGFRQQAMKQILDAQQNVQQLLTHCVATKP